MRKYHIKYLTILNFNPDATDIKYLPTDMHVVIYQDEYGTWLQKDPAEKNPLLEMPAKYRVCEEIVPHDEHDVVRKDRGRCYLDEGRGGILAFSVVINQLTVLKLYTDIRIH